jgi:hypothetical protein
LAPREAVGNPWHEVHIDSIGPWKIKLNGQQMEFRALTCIEPVTNLLEIVYQPSTKAADAWEAFRNVWLSRYPRPFRCVHDNGPEFNGHNFQFPLDEAGIKSVRISSHTPTSNGIIEAVHKTVGQVIRTLVAVYKPTTKEEATILMHRALSTAMHACRAASSGALSGLSLGAVVFRRDMHLDIPLIADILTLQNNRQVQIDGRLHRENQRRRRHEYLVGHKIYVHNKNTSSDKLKPIFSGPFSILQVHTNNCVTIQRGPNIQERVSIRRIKPSLEKL